ncbi:hypothetical protein LTR70_009703 [Exophiala xenobiotica]|uniref:Uncharacterized protein n=1 Tax=Lithohypha guttulata TaxID=1690604 RepID=A0ABR0JWK3_9EURO|nr:hypothetical protein LTR24_009590 [Lithohypha guttulata]KAK5310143.1 hypothetical protein LTR70_009703 [Exophiala xenobiotica]
MSSTFPEDAKRKVTYDLLRKIFEIGQQIDTARTAYMSEYAWRSVFIPFNQAYAMNYTVEQFFSRLESEFDNGIPFPLQMWDHLWDRLITLVADPDPECAAAVSHALSQLIPPAKASLENNYATHIGSWYANLSDKLEEQVDNQSPAEWKTDTQKAWEGLRREAAIHFLYVKFKQTADSARDRQPGIRAPFDQELRAF